jgi:predicted Na+-dependent transporter
LLFAGQVGLVIIPVMVFHQIQLMVCASLARHYAARGGVNVGNGPNYQTTSISFR